ncbi:PREDICTED: transport and Golgi organization protein 6 homolog isoform X1 [Amphimedon queenslandica]|nr:PREDICTED: transport and Golgi organization protein 6 homolog isoform X1 [Amphimedon queenslandica]|eukprot:XP_019850388.1 PREDICTED: transport and Golgi organization protein 6 homolog isoform X1 [Amphimedon queenslandica]
MKELISSDPDPLAPSGWMERIQYNLKKSRSNPILTSSAIKDVKLKYKLELPLDQRDEDYQWGFVLESLALLLLLRNTINNSPSLEGDPAAMLSLSDNKTTKGICQFVLSLGLHLYLDAKRPISPSATGINTSTKLIPESVKSERICIIIHSLCDCLDSEELSSIILQTLLTGLLAGLFQIIYKPLLESASPSPSTPRVVSKSFSDPEVFESHLKNLLKALPRPLLVRELLSLQVMGRTRRSGLLWLRKACGEHLSRVLMESNGVQSVLRGIFEASTGNDGLVSESVTESSQNWHKCQSIAQILSSCPLQAESIEKYYSLVCPQILSLIGLPPDGVGRHFLRVAVCTVTQMLSKQYDLSMKYIVIPLLRPLYVLTEDGDFQDITQLASSVEICLKNLNRILEVIEPTSLVVTSLAEYLPLLFDIWSCTRKYEALITKKSKQCLISTFKLSDSLTQLEFLKFLLHIHETDTQRFKALRSDIKITLSTKGGDLIIAREEEMNVSSKTSSETMSEIGTAITDLVEGELKSTGIKSTLFTYCMEYIGNLLASEAGLQKTKKQETAQPMKGASSRTLLDWERSSMHSSEGVSFSNALVLYLLASLCEGMDIETIKTLDLQSTVQALALLVKSHGIYHQKDKPISTRQEEGKETELLTGGDVTLSIAFGLLSAILASEKKLNPRLQSVLTSLLPYLESLACHCPNEELSGLAEDLRICIATLGSVWSEKMTEGVTEMTKKKTREETLDKEKVDSLHSSNARASRPLIEVIGSTDNNETLYARALKDIQDSLIPVKGHGLQQLSQLVRKKDSETLAHIDHTIELFLTHLGHSDTYIYLPSIQGLVELASLVPDRIIPLMCNEYAQFNEARKARASCGTLEGKSIDWLVKLGEGLVRASRECGDLLPKYSESLLAAVLSNIKHGDPLVRSSGLSNLADICSSLHWSFTPVENEVVECLEKVLKTDSDPTVRRGAISVTKHLFKGLGTNIDKVLQGGSLLSLYRMLKVCESSDPDQLTRTHAQSALAELGDVMKLILFPPPNSQKLCKKISVLDHIN